jgi:hypothetical protein
MLPYRGDAFYAVSLIKKLFTGQDFKPKSKKAARFIEEYSSEEVAKF